MKYLHGHTDQDTAILIDDYPYGFRLRTSIRYWIETTNHGERFCSQTVNPKTNRWNKPKKSTYSDIRIITQNDSDGHIHAAGFGAAYSNEEELNKFLGEVGEEDLTPYQANQVKKFRAVYDSRKHFTV